MTIKRFISFLVSTTLLISLVVPAGAHTHVCAGTEAVHDLLDRANVEAHSDGHHHHEGTEAPNHHHDDAAIDTHAPHDHSTLTSSGASICCWDGGATHARTTVDTPTVPSIDSKQLVVVAVQYLLFLASPVTLQMCGAPHGVKIGASPPYLASTSQVTYLRISSFLI